MYRLIHQAVFRSAFQVFSDFSAEDKLRVLKGFVIDQPIQFGTVNSVNLKFMLYSEAVDGKHTAIGILDFNASGVDVIFAFYNLFHMYFLSYLLIFLIFLLEYSTKKIRSM